MLISHSDIARKYERLGKYSIVNGIMLDPDFPKPVRVSKMRNNRFAKYYDMEAVEKFFSRFPPSRRRRKKDEIDTKDGFVGIGGNKALDNPLLYQSQRFYRLISRCQM